MSDATAGKQSWAEKVADELFAGLTIFPWSETIVALRQAYELGQIRMRERAADVSVYKGRRHICPSCGLTEEEEMRERLRWEMGDNLAQAIRNLKLEQEP